MSTSSLLLLIVSVSISALAQISFKLGLVAAGAGADGASLLSSTARALLMPQVMLGLGLYGVGTIVWLTALGRLEVSQAYPFVGLGFVLTAILGRLVFGDDLSIQRIAGIALVIAGIVLISTT